MNSTALAVIQPQELDTIQRAAALLAASGYFDGKGETKQAIAMMATKIMAGRELGFGPFASANGVHIIQGRPSIGANLMASAVKNNGRYDYRVRELTNEQCIIEFFEREGDKKVSIGISTFSMNDAKAAQLIGKDNWRKHPKNMLFARALSNGVRWYCADVFAGNAVYVPEELGAEVDGDGNVVDTTFTVAQQDAHSASVLDSATEAPSAPQRSSVPASEDVDSNGDVLFDRDADGTPAHQRCFGVGLSVFGPAWRNGGRAWLLKKWSGKVTPDNVRDSLVNYSEDEKDQLADYMDTHRAALQRIWREYEASKQAVA